MSFNEEVLTFWEGFQLAHLDGKKTLSFDMTHNSLSLSVLTNYGLIIHIN